MSNRTDNLTRRNDVQVLDTHRIDHLISGAVVAEHEITVVGVGSGGASVIQQLAMCGIGRWNLFDPDRLEAVNLVKHPARRSDLGRPKVEVMAEWLADRNPAATVAHAVEDARSSDLFQAAVERSSLVICAVDNAASRSWVNAECVRLARPCVTGSVIRTGLGGEVYLYVPGETGCLSCIQLVADSNGWGIEDAIDLTDEERHHRYGLGEENFTTSGLAVDITLVASYHAHMVWSVLMGGRTPYVPRLNFNWLTIGIRPEKGVFTTHYTSNRVLVRPQKHCYLGCGLDGDPAATREE